MNLAFQSSRTVRIIPKTVIKLKTNKNFCTTETNLLSFFLVGEEMLTFRKPVLENKKKIMLKSLKVDL